MNSNPSQEAGHERRDANVKWIVAVVIGVFVCGMGMHVAIGGFMGWLNKTPVTTDAWQPMNQPQAAPDRPPAPVLQVSPPRDLKRFREKEDEELETYGWIDRSKGIARIPIEQAMALVLQEGLPARSSPNENATGPSTYQLVHKRADHRETEIQGTNE